MIQNYRIYLKISGCSIMQDWYICCRSQTFFPLYYNYLQLLYREDKGIILHQGFSRLILLRSECFVAKIGRGNPWSSKVLISQRCIQFYRLLRWKCVNFFSKTLYSGWLFYITVLRDELNNSTSLCWGNHRSLLLVKSW